MNCRVNMTYFVINHDILFISAKKMKKSHRNILLLAIGKFVAHTLHNRLLQLEA